MGAISYFDVDTYGKIRGSSFGEPDGTEHELELLEGNGRMILRVKLADNPKAVDLLFNIEQAMAFSDAITAIEKRIITIAED